MNPAAWLDSLFAAIDRMDTDAFAEHLAPEAEFQFVNLPPVKGAGYVADFVGGFFKSIRGLRHALLEHWACGDTLVCRGNVTYFRHDGGEVTVPFANIMKLADGKAAEYRIYADVSPLFAAVM